MVIGFVIAALLAGLLIYLAIDQDVYAAFSNRDAITQAIKYAGPWGPAVFVLLQALQIIIAPIPGQIATLIGGYLFGGAWGAVYSMTGSLVGFTAVFYAARRLGRPLLERYFDTDSLQKFDYLTRSAGPMVFFMIFLLPGFPDDLVCYLAGLTKIKMTTLVVVSLLGRLPSTVMTSYIGSGVASSNLRSVRIMTAIFVVIVAISYWQRARLEAWAQKIAGK